MLARKRMASGGTSLRN